MNLGTLTEKLFNKPWEKLSPGMAIVRVYFHWEAGMKFQPGALSEKENMLKSKK